MSDEVGEMSGGSRGSQKKRSSEMPCPKCNGFMGPMSDICHDCGHVDGEPGMSRWLLSMVVIVTAFAVAAAFVNG